MISINDLAAHQAQGHTSKPKHVEDSSKSPILTLHTCIDVSQIHSPMVGHRSKSNNNEINSFFRFAIFVPQPTNDKHVHSPTNSIFFSNSIFGRRVPSTSATRYIRNIRIVSVPNALPPNIYMDIALTGFIYIVILWL